MLSQPLLTETARRAALLLADWINLGSVDKSDSGTSLLATALLARLDAATATPPPADVVTQIAAELERQFYEQRNMALVYVSLSTDYGPNHTLSALAETCGISSTWPIKSRLSISFGENHHSGRVEPPTIFDSRGYGDEGSVYTLVADRGWLVTPCPLDARFLPVVLAALDRGELAAGLAKLEPLIG
jgi:hypothetical protein